MARIWQEGFEDGLPNVEYLEGNPNSQYANNLALSDFPNLIYTSSGRNDYSLKCLVMKFPNSGAGEYGISKSLGVGYSELYLRVYVKLINAAQNYTMRELVWFSDSSNNLLSVYHTTSADATAFSVYARVGGTYSLITTFTLTSNTWHKIELYYKVNASTGAYEVKIDDVSIASDNSLNTGIINIKKVSVGFNPGTANARYDVHVDDIALNDTSGAVNNSWCGSGTIVSLKPKAAGTTTQWDTSQGYALGEAGTTTTNVKITAHGLANNDVCYNKTRNAYRIVTYVDADNFTVSSVTSQTTGDVFVNFTNAATITAGTGTGTSFAYLTGHTLVSYDVTVNTTRSNAIRRVIYVTSTAVVNAYTTIANGTLGSTVTSQASGDLIKTFKVKQYPIANHWETVSKSDPNPQVCNIETSTVNDIDTFDMEELILDKSIPLASTIVAVSHNIYAQDMGTGSTIKPIFRIGSTDYAGDTIALSSGTLQYQTIYNTSPATEVAFTIGEIDGLEAGVKLV